jgi:hypothetical protein
VHTCKDPAAYDALDIAQWEFYVMPAHHVRDCGYKSVTISWVRRYPEAVPFDQLAAAIEAAGECKPAEI